MICQILLYGEEEEEVVEELDKVSWLAGCREAGDQRID